MIEREIWKPVVGHESSYEVSNLGRIKRTKSGPNTFTGRILRPSVNSKGYLRVNLCGSRKWYSCHSLVAAAFIGPRPEGLEINHIDGDKTNNHADNLEYVTSSENHKHAFSLGLKNSQGENNPRHILTEDDVPQIRRLLNEGVLTQKEIGNMYGVNAETISCIKNSKSWGWLK